MSSSLDISDCESTILQLSSRIESEIASLRHLSNTTPSSSSPSSDWTKVYSFWDKYADDEVCNSGEPTNTPDNSASSSITFDKDDIAATLGHNHDHSNERELFVKPENEKFQLCEDNFLMANQLYIEGNWNRSIEHYKLSLSYFEYCFPDDTNLQERLASMRIDSMCSLGSCLNNQGNYGDASEILTKLLNEKPNNILALLRRSQAYRHRDLYDKARVDLRAAKAIDPTNPLVMYEVERLNTRELNSFAAEKDMFRNVLLNEGYDTKKVRSGRGNMKIYALSGDEVAAVDVTAPLEPNLQEDKFMIM